MVKSYKNVKLLPSANGRTAVYTRKGPGHPWVQVESIYGAASLSENLADTLEHNETERASYLQDNGDVDWTEDAAANPPKSLED